MVGILTPDCFINTGLRQIQINIPRPGVLASGRGPSQALDQVVSGIAQKLVPFKCVAVSGTDIHSIYTLYSQFRIYDIYSRYTRLLMGVYDDFVQKGTEWLFVISQLRLLADQKNRRQLQPIRAIARQFHRNHSCRLN